MLTHLFSSNSCDKIRYCADARNQDDNGIFQSPSVQTSLPFYCDLGYKHRPVPGSTYPLGPGKAIPYCCIGFPQPLTYPNPGPISSSHPLGEGQLKKYRDFPSGAVRLCAPNAMGPGSIPGQGTRSHMHAANKSLHATTKEPTYRN